mgnify:CR=1 FL=1
MTTHGEIILYQTNDGNVRLDVRLQDETVWLTQAMMAELFGTTVPNVSMHLLVREVFAMTAAEHVAGQYEEFSARRKEHREMQGAKDCLRQLEGTARSEGSR